MIRVADEEDRPNIKSPLALLTKRVGEGQIERALRLIQSH
jgi:hypothetical protein